MMRHGVIVIVIAMAGLLSTCGDESGSVRAPATSAETNRIDPAPSSVPIDSIRSQIVSPEPAERLRVLGSTRDLAPQLTRCSSAMSSAVR
jgi:hypothetical protein